MRWLSCAANAFGRWLGPLSQRARVPVALRGAGPLRLAVHGIGSMEMSGSEAPTDLSALATRKKHLRNEDNLLATPTNKVLQCTRLARWEWEWFRAPGRRVLSEARDSMLLMLPAPRGSAIWARKPKSIACPPTRSPDPLPFPPARVVYAMALLLVLSVLGCKRDTRQPGYEIRMLSDMVRPVPAEAFVVPMRMPVAGTVSREADWESPDGRQNPIPVTPENLARGKFVYENYCLVCHGITGEGDGPMIPKYPNPPAFASKRVMDLSSAQIYESITNGKKEMAAYAGHVRPEDRWKVVMYIEKLQEKIR